MGPTYRASVLTLAAVFGAESFALRSRLQLRVQVAQVAQAGPHHVVMIHEIRAEACARQKFVVSDEYDECLHFMTEACNPGPDMLMNGDPDEVSTGKGYCTDFFSNYKAHLPGGNASVAPVSGGQPGGESLAALSDNSREEEADYPERGDRAVAGAEEMQDVMAEVGELMRSRSSSTDELKEDLAALSWYEDELHAKIDALDADEYCRQVGQESVLVGEETSAPEMAEMLAEMRCEMHRYSAPFYARLVQKKLDEVVAEQKELVRRIEERKLANRTRAIEDVAAPEVEAAVEPAAAPAAPHEEEPNKDWSWWQICLVLFVVACLAGAFLAGRRLRQWRSE